MEELSGVCKKIVDDLARTLYNYVEEGCKLGPTKEPTLNIHRVAFR